MKNLPLVDYDCDCEKYEAVPVIALMLLLMGQGIIWGLIGFVVAWIIYAV